MPKRKSLPPKWPELLPTCFRAARPDGFAALLVSGKANGAPPRTPPGAVTSPGPPHRAGRGPEGRPGLSFVSRMFRNASESGKGSFLSLVAGKGGKAPPYRLLPQSPCERVLEDPLTQAACFPACAGKQGQRKDDKDVWGEMTSPAWFRLRLPWAKIRAAPSSAFMGKRRMFFRDEGARFAEDSLLSTLWGPGAFERPGRKGIHFRRPRAAAPASPAPVQCARAARHAGEEDARDWMHRGKFPFPPGVLSEDFSMAA